MRLVRSIYLYLCVAFRGVLSGVAQIQPVAQLVRDTAGVMQEYTQRGGVRPFGVSLLVAGYDDDGPQLFQVREIFLCWRFAVVLLDSCSRRSRCSYVSNAHQRVISLVLFYMISVIASIV